MGSLGSEKVSVTLEKAMKELNPSGCLVPFVYANNEWTKIVQVNSTLSDCGLVTGDAIFLISETDLKDMPHEQLPRKLAQVSFSFLS